MSIKLVGENYVRLPLKKDGENDYCSGGASRIEFDSYSRYQEGSFDHAFIWGSYLDVDRAVIEERSDGSIVFFEETENGIFKGLFPYTKYFQTGYIIHPELAMGNACFDLQADVDDNVFDYEAKKSVWSVQYFTCSYSNSWFGEDEVIECWFDPKYSFTKGCGIDDGKCEKVFNSSDCHSEADLVISEGLLPLISALYINNGNDPDIGCFLQKLSAISACYSMLQEEYFIHG